MEQSLHVYRLDRYRVAYDKYSVMFALFSFTQKKTKLHNTIRLSLAMGGKYTFEVTTSSDRLLGVKVVMCKQIT